VTAAEARDDDAREGEGVMTKRMVLALLAVGGVFLSSYLTLFKLGYIGHLACGAGSCELVQTSRWSTLFGLPVAGWGAGFYLTALVVSVIGTQPRFADSAEVSWLLVGLTGWGVLFSGYLTALELLVIHAICEYCVSSAVLVTIMFAVATADVVGTRKVIPG
jgi:uncharacterized membrane protein